MRVSVDIGGTFTDLVVESADGVSLYKAPTVPDAPVRGVLDVLRTAADATGVRLAELLGGTETFIHATTRALNAIVTGSTARTALLTTAGHPDVLLLREGGREDPFDFTVAYPEPYVPRSLTFEVRERVTSDGSVLLPLDSDTLVETCDLLAAADVEAVAVCLLWSTVNPVHELLVGEELARRLPGVPVTLAHRLNPSLREYRRASSAAIDASLKPIMTDYLHELEDELRSSGFAGRLLMVTSAGGVLEADAVADAPIHTVNSGPAMAPVAGRGYAKTDAAAGVAIIADAGGTTYDVTLARAGRIPWTRETWIGPRYLGHMTGFPSIDVKSVGAGGGSIAWVDAGGLLHVGPQSAGSLPGPACYGRGGVDATVTDAAVVLGYLDPSRFASGTMRLDADAAADAVQKSVAEPLGTDLVTAADAVMRLTTEQMARAIEEITLEQGIDPADAVLVGGGGAAGLNAVAVAQRLGCRQLVVPAVGAALAAAGALMSDLTATYTQTVPVTSDAFDAERVNAALRDLVASCRAFAERVGGSPRDTVVELFAEAHYPQQIWELDVPLRVERFTSSGDVDDLVADFHAVHERVLGVAEPDSPIEIVSWGAGVRCPLRADEGPLPSTPAATADVGRREVHFAGPGNLDVPVWTLGSLGDEALAGPGVVESAFTTVVVPPGGVVRRSSSGSLLVTPGTTEVHG